MNLAHSIIVLSFILISEAYGIAGSIDQKVNYRMQADKVESVQRVIEIDNLRDKLKAESLFLQRLTTEFTGNEVILLEPTIYVTQDYNGDIQILGELQNTSTFDVSFVKITYTFKNLSDQILDTESTYINGSSKIVSSAIITDSILSTGEVGSFKLYTSVPYDLVSSMYYTISFKNYETHPLRTIIEQNGDVTKQPDNSGDLKLIGEVKNTGNEIAYFVKYVATIKNNNNQVIDVGYSYISGRSIELESGITTDTALFPNDIASFKIYTFAEYTEYDTFTYKINWYEGRVASKKINLSPLLLLLLSESDKLILNTWTGPAGFGNLEFITDSDLTEINRLKFVFSNFSCGGEINNGTFTVSLSVPISNRKFTRTVTFYPDDQMTITGEFNVSGDLASGTWEALINDTTCSGTWEASPL